MTLSSRIGTPPTLALEDVTVSYRRVPAIHHLSVHLQCGSCVALMGPNGAGKTTLIKAIAGLLRIETGRILFKGGLLTPSGRTIAYVPQREAIDWDFPVTVQGLVEMGRFPALGLWRRFTRNDARLVAEAMEVMDLGEFADRQIGKLSGGQQQRAFLARAWAQQSDIYLLDEPFNGLDRNARDAFRKSLHALRDAGKLVIASHHDHNDVGALFDQVLLINGELVAHGPVAETFTEDRITRTFGTRIFTGATA